MVALSMVYYIFDNFGAFCREREIPDWTTEDYN